MNQALAKTKILPTTAQPCIVQIRDPFKPEELDYEFVGPGTTVADHLQNYDLVTAPTLVLYNQQPLLEADWEQTTLDEGDVLMLVVQPGELFTIIFFVTLAITAVLAAYSLYTILTLDEPDPGSKNDSPTYTISYRGNQRRPGQPIPVVYGEMRTYPDVTGTHTRYAGRNDQWMWQIFDLTLGECETITADDIQYEDTPLTNFDEYEIEHVPPGGTSELYPRNYFDSSEVSNIELVSLDQRTLTYAANPVGTEVHQLIFYITAPSGMYWIHDRNGEHRWKAAGVRLEWRLFGSADPWQEEIFQIPFSVAPRKYSKFIRVAPGRYEVRCSRTKTKGDPDGYKNTSTNAVDDVFWEAFSAGEVGKERTETTRLAIRIRASEAIGNGALSRMNVRVRRKISIWDSTNGWGTPVHTKLAAYAFMDACKNFYGGALDDKYIDLAHLESLTGYGVEFNGVFDGKLTLWNALNEIARPMNGRAVQKAGGVYSIALDLPDQPPVAMFTMRNIVRGSFSIEHNLPVDDKTNFVRATFKNREEGYRETIVDCVPNGITPDKPYEIRLRGVTDGDAAYAIGIRMANESRWRKKQITFETALEGFIPNFMQTIRVGHYMLGLEQTVDAVSGGVKSHTGNVLTVVEDLSHLISETDIRCFLMDTDGSPWGPVSCTVPNESTIDLGANTPPAGILVYGDDHDEPKYCVGLGDDFMMTAKVLSVQHSGEHRVRITAVEDNPNVYIEDAPPTYSPIDPPVDLTPRVEELKASLYGRGDNLYARLSWIGHNSDYYLVEMSLDAQVTWEEIDRPTDSELSVAIPLQDGIVFRVRGFSVFPGPPAFVTVDAINRPVAYPIIYDLRPMYPFNGRRIGVAWQQLQEGKNAFLKFIFNGVEVVNTLVDHTVSFFEIDHDVVMQAQSRVVHGQQFPAAGCRTVTVRLHGAQEVDGVWLEDTSYEELVMTNDPMGRILNLVATIEGEVLNVKFDWPENDPGAVFVYASPTAGFTPSDDNLVHHGDSNSFAIVGQFLHPSTQYVLIGACDRWGPDNIDYWPEFQVQSEDPSPLEDYFVDGVLQIPHGGTASTTATGSGETVLATSPALAGNPTAPTQGTGDNSTRIATTAFVKSLNYATDVDLTALENRIATLEGHFVAGVLEVVHGGTGTTTSTGTGSVVLSSGAVVSLGSGSTATHPPAADSTAKIATTQWCYDQGFGGDPPDLSGYAPLDSPAFIGTPTAPTPSTGNDSTQLATTAFVKNQNYLVAADLSGYAPLASPVFTGDPRAPTPLTSDNDTSIATTAFVKAQNYLVDADLNDLEGRVATLEGYFTTGVLDIVHGGTGSTTATGTGSVVLASSPTLTGNPKAPTPLTSDNDTSIATTAFVKAQNYLDQADYTDLDGRITTNYNDVTTIADWFGGRPGPHVLQVIYGGTGVTTSTGTGSVVLNTDPALAGNPTAPTQSSGNSSTRIATTAFVKNQNYLTSADLSGYAPINSPLFTGDPRAPTPLTSDNDTSIATTAFVKAQNYLDQADFDNLQAQITSNDNDLDVVGGWFQNGNPGWILKTVNGGTETDTATGSGSNVLATSPALAGSPTATTASTSSNSSRIATTAFVHALVNESGNTTWDKGSNSNGDWIRNNTTGLIMQWGYFDEDTLNNGTAVITYPIAFTSTNHAIIPTVHDSSSGSNGLDFCSAYRATSKTTTGCSISVPTNAGGTFLVIGY
jgi:sulfur carrier protein ThiS